MVHFFHEGCGPYLKGEKPFTPSSISNTGLIDGVPPLSANGPLRFIRIIYIGQAHKSNINVVLVQLYIIIYILCLGSSNRKINIYTSPVSIIFLLSRRADRPNPNTYSNNDTASSVRLSSNLKL